MTTILTTISTIIKDSLFINLLFEFLDLPVNSYGGKKKIASIESIELKNVSYYFQNSKEPVLKKINMKIERGTTIGIVGKNGAGKSTLLKILLGFYHNYEGEILVNGINLKEIDYSSYWGKIGCLFQDFVKYELSLKENVALENWKKENDEKLIKNILYQVNFPLNTLENNLDTILGLWFGDRQLSAGEARC